MAPRGPGAPRPSARRSAAGRSGIRPRRKDRRIANTTDSHGADAVVGAARGPGRGDQVRGEVSPTDHRQAGTPPGRERRGQSGSRQRRGHEREARTAGAASGGDASASRAPSNSRTGNTAATASGEWCEDSSASGSKDRAGCGRRVHGSDSSARRPGCAPSPRRSARPARTPRAATRPCTRYRPAFLPRGIVESRAPHAEGRRGGERHRASERRLRTRGPSGRPHTRRPVRASASTVRRT